MAAEETMTKKQFPQWGVMLPSRQHDMMHMKDSYPVIHKYHTNYLPHWRAEHAVYFVTYRVYGSLPSFLFRDIDMHQREIFANAERLQRPLTVYEEDELEALHFRRLALTKYDQGNRFLEDPRVADIVAAAFPYFDGVRYTLFAWVVMADHVHVVLQPNNEWKLSEIIDTWKTFTARKSNKILGRSGPFWQREYYDHLVRNDDDLSRCINYTWENPEKAGLHDWRWRWKRAGF
jgi:REP element-mobilizing transposase RayT